MNKASTFLLPIALMLFLPGCRSGGGILHFAPETSAVTGVLRQDMYLSTMEGSDTEWMNDTLVLCLDTPVTIAPRPGSPGTPSPVLKDIALIEIENDSDIMLQDLIGKRVTLTGTITLITELPGFHRQVSTPVQIRMAKMVVLGE